MSDLLNPANLIVLAVIAVGMFFGLRRIAASTRGKSCCSDGASGKKAKKVVVVDTDASHYPYSDELLIGGMSCDGCAQNVANALNAFQQPSRVGPGIDHKKVCYHAGTVDAFPDKGFIGEAVGIVPGKNPFTPKPCIICGRVAL